MADRINDNADLAVDEMKRKSRRRLIGAIVLALGAATLLPLALEKDPKPLGDDVAVQIPPVDDGKFVNRLSGQSRAARAKGGKGEPRGAGKDENVRTEAGAEAPAPLASTTGATMPAAENRIAPAPAAPLATETPAATATVSGAPRPSLSEAEQRVLLPSTKAPAKAAPAPAASTALPAAPAPAAPPPAAQADTKGEAAASDASAVNGAGFVVQLAAFSDDKGANALANRLKGAGYAAYVEPLQTSRATLWRVRVGGYATRNAAIDARDKLKADGYSGIVAPAK